MKSPLFLFLCSSWVVFFIHGVKGADEVLTATCKKIADQNVTYEFCMASLSADPKSHTAADVSELYRISIGVASANMSNTWSYIQNLVQRQTDPQMKRHLENCRWMYFLGNFSLDHALDLFNSKNYNKAGMALDVVVETPGNCEKGFQDAPAYVSPLTKINNLCYSVLLIPFRINYGFL